MARSRFIAIFSATPERLLEAAPILSPLAEVFPPDGLILEVPARYEAETLERISRALPDRDLRIGGASTRTAAVFAARISPGTLIPTGKEADYLAEHPVEWLAWHAQLDERILETLAHWGIHTLGDFASLPEEQLVARLGQCAVPLQKMARGEDTELLSPYRQAPEFIETRVLDWEVNNLEPLGFILGGMLESLCGKLQSRGLAVEKISVRLGLINGEPYERHLRLALPMRDPKSILSLLRLDLQSSPPDSGIEEITIEAHPAHPRIFQHSLLQPSAPSPENLARTLTRLKAVVGEANVGTPFRLDTHRPDAFILREMELHPRPRKRTHSSPSSRRIETTRQLAFLQDERTLTYNSTHLSLRRLRPPRVIDLQADRILSCAGPWRSSGDWWDEESSPNGWSREEWDIELTDGGIYRVYWDQASRQWFMEGVYD